jgi:hypothetical protein
MISADVINNGGARNQTRLSGARPVIRPSGSESTRSSGPTMAPKIAAIWIHATPRPRSAGANISAAASRDRFAVPNDAANIAVPMTNRASRDRLTAMPASR